MKLSKMNHAILDYKGNEIVKNLQDNLTRIERWKSMLLDHFIFCCTVLPIFIIILLGLEQLNLTNKSIKISISVLIYGMYLNKDAFSGRSAAKRILGQIIIDNKTELPANEIKCLIRNFTMLFWPIEVLIILIQPSKRVGDILAGTKVVRTEKETLGTIVNEIIKMNRDKVLLSFGLAIIYVITVGYCFIYFF